MKSKGHQTDLWGQLLEPAKFVAGLLRYSASRHFPNATDHLTNEALAVEEQIKALDAIDSESKKEINKKSLERILRWIGPKRWTGIDRWTKIDRGKGTPPGGAAFANAKILSEIAIKLHEKYNHEYSLRIRRMKEKLEYMKLRNNEGWLNELEYEYDLDHMKKRIKNIKPEIFNKIILDKIFITDIANELASASLNDPNNIDVLKNLSVLYSILNDTERTKIVNMLIKKAIND